MTAETITILATAGAALVGAADYLRSGGAFSSAGRIGTFWFDHPADLPFEQRPREDEVDLPIPRRPLRGRID